MGTIGTAGDQDRFAVELEAGRTYRFDLTGSPGGGGTLPDTFFRAIYDSEGRYQPDSYNDDFEGGRDSRVTFTASESGTYYARVSGDRDETGSYTLSVTDVTGQVEAVFVPGPPETELESSPGQSTPGAGTRENVSEGGTDLPRAPPPPVAEVDVGGSVTGNIGFGGDGDWFRVELEAGKRYQIDMEGMDTNRGTLPDPWLFSIARRGRYSLPLQARGTTTAVWAITPGRSSRPPRTGTSLRVGDVRGGSGTGHRHLHAVGDLPGRKWRLGGRHGLSRRQTSPFGRVDVGASATGNITAQGTKTGSISIWRRARNTRSTWKECGPTAALCWIRISISFRLGWPCRSNTANDDFERHLNSRLTYTPPTTGTYFLHATEANNSDTGTYTLSVRGRMT